MDIKIKKAKTARGLPKRTGKRGTGKARHGHTVKGKNRTRAKKPTVKGVAVRVSGFYVVWSR